LNLLFRLQVSRRCLCEKVPDSWLHMAPFRRRFRVVPRFIYVGGSLHSWDRLP
jgi:hypothetical protein